MLARIVPQSIQRRVKLMPGPIVMVAVFGVAFGLFMAAAVLLGTLRGRAPSGWTYQDEPVTSLAGSYVMLGSLVAVVSSFFCRHWLAWLGLVIFFVYTFLTGPFWVPGTGQVAVVLYVLARSDTRAYFWRRLLPEYASNPES